MTNNTIVFSVASFIAGAVLYSFIANQQDVTYLINEDSGAPKTETNNQYVSYEKLEEQLILINNKIAENTIKLDRMLEIKTSKTQMQKSASEVASEENISNSENQLTEDDINRLKSDIFSSLTNPNTSLLQILNSAELRELPQHEKDETIAEIVRQVNSGEILLKTQ